MQVKRKGRREEGRAGIYAGVLVRGERLLVCAFVCAGADEARQHVRPPLSSVSVRKQAQAHLPGTRRPSSAVQLLSQNLFRSSFLKSDRKSAAYILNSILSPLSSLPSSLPLSPFPTPHQHRLDKVRELRWETGGAVIPTHLQRKLSAKESDFFASYDKLLSEYMGHYPLLDLTGSTLVRSRRKGQALLMENIIFFSTLLSLFPVFRRRLLILFPLLPPSPPFSNLPPLQPPKEMCIEVRVLADCGEVMTDQGPVNLEKGTNHFLRRADVEGLIRQGLLQHVGSASSAQSTT